MTTVSTVIPTYNRASTLARALHSVYAQTVMPEEVIVIDDGSTDATADVVALFPDVVFIRLTQNCGAAHARNQGIRAASGKLVAFLDSDDVWAINKLEAQLSAFQSFPDLALLCTGITIGRQSGTFFYCGKSEHRPQGQWTFADFQTYPFSPSTWLASRKQLIKCGLFDESMDNCEDLDLLARINRIGTIAMIAPPLTTKYNLPDSLDANLDKRSRSLDRLFEKHRETWLLTPDSGVMAFLTLASRHFSAGNIKQGRLALKQALQLKPFSVKVWSRIALSAIFGAHYQRIQKIVRGSH